MSGFSEYDNSDGLGLAPLVRAGEISATELLDEAIDRAERVNGQLNAVVHKLYVAVAAGIVPLAHASDGGGSIRIPASCCGLV